MYRSALACPCEFIPAKPSTSPGIRNLPVQSMTRAPLGMGTAKSEPTSVIRPSRTMTTAFSMSFAERPQSVTSTTVPPASTSGIEGDGLGANGDGACAQAKATAQIATTGPEKMRREARIRKSGLVWIVAHGLRCTPVTLCRQAYPRSCGGSARRICAGPCWHGRSSPRSRQNNRLPRWWRPAQ